jgi:arylsulfatase A-like enzyme
MPISPKRIGHLVKTVHSDRDSVAFPAWHRLGPIDVLLLSAWCGLAAGELEVGARVISKSLSSTDRLYQMTRHFVWLVPLINLALFLGFGLFLAAATRLWPRRAGWLSPRLIFAWAVLPALLVAGRGIYTEAWLIFALGFASFVAPMVERNPSGMRRRLARSLPLLLAAVVIQGSLLIGGDRLQRWREEGRPLPPPDSPNVLLIVLDTVRADHLSVYGYERPTTPNLERLAARSIRFEQARAAAPWTLASHASVFTARWPHELAVKWMYPMSRNFPTLAEYLGSLGYATAGFVGNTFYCSYDSGLDRGFTHYEDYVLETLPALRTVHLVDLSLKTFAQLGLSLPTSEPILWQLTREDRKDARVVNREFLDWLTARREPSRPFFAFLNYADAHAPYVLPPGAKYRFGSVPKTPGDFLFLSRDWIDLDKLRLPQPARVLARDSYDNCLGYLDERLGELFGELQRRGVLDRTVLIVTADHGEGMGEHELFDHGESLYGTEIRVPLLIALPSGRASGTVVGEPVSLRSLSATIVDLVSPGTKPPFPGRPLTGRRPEPASARADSVGDDAVLSELSAPNPRDPNQGRSPARTGRLISIAHGDLVYIHHEGDGTEELFNIRDDPRELLNRVRSKAMLPLLQRFRERLETIGVDRPVRRDEPGYAHPADLSEVPR